jgi:hypothetical protein
MLTYKLTKALKVFFILIFLIGFVILAWEMLFKLFSPIEAYHWDKRYMLFEEEGGGSVFNNIDSIFKYQNNKKINSTTYYHLDNQWIKEYSYQIKTNNYGLAQADAISPKTPSLLFLGDSFTEGHGASSWFDRWQQKINSSIQLINGGLLGTGFMQWEMQLNDLVNHEINVKYLVVIFISDDYQRKIWNFPEQTLKCISNYNECIGYENFYGMPPSDIRPKFLEKLSAFRSQTLNQFSLWVSILQQIPATVLIYQFLQNGFKFAKDTEASINEGSEKTIKSLVDRFQKNIIFIHLPQKDEVKFGRINPGGMLSRDAIRKAGGLLVDGFSACNLNNADYFPNDGHPNKDGYFKIEACVSSAIPREWVAPR